MSPARPSTDSKDLALGWVVTPQGDPEYWLRNRPRPGSQKEGDLVRVPAATMGTHAAIVAQSGSGKSAFLGRLVEELMLKTRARCLIFDPNADFRRVAEVAEESLWSQGFDRETGLGRLPTERSRAEFASRWEAIGPKVATRISPWTDEDDPVYERISLWWPALDADILAFDLNSQQRSELRSCHHLVRGTSEYLNWARSGLGLGSMGTVDAHVVVEKLYHDWQRPIHFHDDEMDSDSSTDESRLLRLLTAIAGLCGLTWRPTPGVGPWDQAWQLLKALREVHQPSTWPFRRRVLVGPLIAEKMPSGEERLYSIGARPAEWEERLDWPAPWLEFKYWLENMVRTFKYVSGPIAKFYFTRATDCSTSGLLAQGEPGPTGTRLKVIDLPSVDDRELRLLVVNALIASEWDLAKKRWSEALAGPPEEDQRVPTFIVVDEAHNLAPASPQNPAEVALLGQFRRIAAEGRKYGLFLILVTQRPDKLDPLTVSECENVALMRLSTQSVLDQARDLLGLRDIHPKTLQKCLEFGRGRVLLAGPWAGSEPKVMYAAARRTVEGGRNLRAEYWGRPPTDGTP